MATDGLTEAAKKEIADAIRIVREDRFESFVRSRFPEPTKGDNDNDPPKDGDPTPPPVKTDDGKPPENESRRSAYWGEIFE